MTYDECLPFLYEGKEIMSRKLNKVLKLAPGIINNISSPNLLSPLIPDTDDWEVVE